MAATTGGLTAAALALSSATAHADSVNWDAIAQCESSGNWSADTGNGFSGGLQFKQSTWQANGGVGSPAKAPREQQIRVGENVLATQGIGAWPTCGARGAYPTGYPAPRVAGGPPVWNARAATGCQNVQGGLPGILDFHQMCVALTNPAQALRGALGSR